MKIEFIGPKLTRGQKIGTSVLCGSASALFLVPPALAPWANVSPTMWAGGLGGPAVIALLFWMVKDTVDENDRRNRHANGAEGERLVEAAEAQAEREHAKAAAR